LIDGAYLHLRIYGSDIAGVKIDISDAHLGKPIFADNERETPGRERRNDELAMVVSLYDTCLVCSLLHNCHGGADKGAARRICDGPVDFCSVDLRECWYGEAPEQQQLYEVSHHDFVPRGAFQRRGYESDNHDLNERT
jgi:hypothetical protein